MTARAAKNRRFYLTLKVHGYGLRSKNIDAATEAEALASFMAWSPVEALLAKAKGHPFSVLFQEVC